MNPIIEAKTHNVLGVKFPKITTGFEKWFLLRSDAHHDNVHCDQKLEREHLEEAKKRGAGIIDYGDLFCAMQGKWDRRADENQLRPELRGNSYLDNLVKYNAEFYEPYAKQFIVMGRGNHETSIEKHHQTNLTDRLVERLNTKTGSKIRTGGYSGWVVFTFLIYGCQTVTYRLFYHHGYGGGGPVTRGVIQTNRMAVYLPDAEIVCSGHTHDEWIVPIQRHRINSTNTVFQDEQVHVRTPGYKDEYVDGFGGWHVERGAPPKPLGAAWLRFFYKPGGRAGVGFEVARCK